MAKQDLSKVAEVRAFARYVHVSPQKLRLVADLIRQTTVNRALEQLKFSSKNAAIPITKLLNSAIANAVHNFNIDRETLFIKSISVDGGPVYKKYAPRAQGRAFVERKRTSHINLILSARGGSTFGGETKKNKLKRATFFKPSKKEALEVKDAAAQQGEVNANENKPKTPRRPAEKRKQNLVDLKRRLFNRKSGE